MNLLTNQKNLQPTTSTLLQSMNSRLSRSLHKSQSSPTRGKELQQVASRRALDVNKDRVRGDKLAESMRQLDDQLSKKSQQQVVKDAKITFTMEDLNPIKIDAAQQQNQQNQEATGDQELANIFEGNLSQKEIMQKIQQLRNQPHLLKRYVLKVQEDKRNDIKEQQKEAFENRILHEKQMISALSYDPPVLHRKQPLQQLNNDALQPRQLIQDYATYNKQLLKQGFFLPQCQERRLLEKQDLEDFKHYDTRLRRENEILTTEITKEMQNQKPVPPRILPITFIQQRAQLLKMMYIASRFSNLFVVSGRFAVIHAQNEQLQQAAIIIQTFWRGYWKYKNYNLRKLAVKMIQQQGRIVIGQTSRQQYVQNLKLVKIFLDEMYFQNTTLGVVYDYKKSVEITTSQIRQAFEQYKQRVSFIAEALSLADEQVAKQQAVQIKTDRILKERTEANAKRGKTTKEIQLSEEDKEVSIDDINACRSDESRLKKASVIIYKILVREYEEDLRVIYQRQKENTHVRYPLFSLIPHSESITAVLNILRQGGNEDQIQELESQENDEGDRIIRRSIV